MFNDLERSTCGILSDSAADYPFSQEPNPTNGEPGPEAGLTAPFDPIFQTNEPLSVYAEVCEQEEEASQIMALDGGEEVGVGMGNSQAELSSSLRSCEYRRGQLEEHRAACHKRLEELSEKYESVTERTSSLHIACDQMLSQQTQLTASCEKIKSTLHYYQQYDWLIKKLQTSKLLLNGSLFAQILSITHECISYLKEHPEQREAAAYLQKYEQCLSRSLTALKLGVLGELEACKEEVLYRQAKSSYRNLNPPEEGGDPKSETASSHPVYVDDDTFASLYGVFGVKSTSVRNMLRQAHQFFSAYPDYQTMVAECEAEYFNLRTHLLAPIVQSTIHSLCLRHQSSSCTLTRDGCIFLLRLCDDEFRLYGQFFIVEGNVTGTSTPKSVTSRTLPPHTWPASASSFSIFTEGLCRILYDTLRPLIIRNPHLETLAQLCTLLKVEMIQDRCGTPIYGQTAQLSNGSQISAMAAGKPEQSANPREGFARVMSELVGDIVERIVYRASLFAQADILDFNPAPGDLNYPERLLMIREIDSSLPQANGKGGGKPSAIDLHCLWYPTVRRAVLCLSKLYKCLDHAVFVSISRELLDACCQSLEMAAEKIRLSKPTSNAKGSVVPARHIGKELDSELFVIKHLLILREQTSPYRASAQRYPHPHPLYNRANSIIGSDAGVAVQRHIYEAINPQFDYSLDLSKYKDSMFQLLSQENSTKWFELSTNNAFLTFLLSTPVYVHELQTDSRRIIESKLKKHCQGLLHTIVSALLGPLSLLVEELRRNMVGSAEGAHLHPPYPEAMAVHECVSESFKKLRQGWPEVRVALTLYIGVKETEDILLQSARKIVLNLFNEIRSFTEKGFTEEQQQIASVPNHEQVWMVLNA